MTVELGGPYYTIMDKYNEKGLNLGHYVGGFVDSWRWRIKRQQNIILQMSVVLKTSTI